MSKNEDLPQYKIGDKVVVSYCPRNDTELGWTGVIVEKRIDGMRLTEGKVWVLIDGKTVPFSYRIEHIRRLTKLDLALK